MEHEVEIEKASKGWWVDCSCGWWHEARTKDHGKELERRHIAAQGGVKNESS